MSKSSKIRVCKEYNILLVRNWLDLPFLITYIITSLIFEFIYLRFLKSIFWKFVVLLRRSLCSFFGHQVWEDELGPYYCVFCKKDFREVPPIDYETLTMIIDDENHPFLHIIEHEPVYEYERCPEYFLKNKKE